MGQENTNFENEVDTGHGAQIPESASDKLYNSIVRIEIKIENKIAKETGFFMKTKIKEKQWKFLCNNFYVINKEY